MGLMVTQGSLRERHRADRRTRIHAAARAHADTLGVDHVTVELITRSAEVSRRTFFNYFATREDAILGVRAPVLPEDALASFLAADGPEPLVRLTVLLARTIKTTVEGQTTLAECRTLASTHPGLRPRLMELGLRAEELVARELQAAGRSRAEVDDALALAGTVFRSLYSRAPDALETSDVRVVASAVARLRRVLADTETTGLGWGALPDPGSTGPGEQPSLPVRPAAG